LPNLTRTAASGGVLNPTANKTSPFVPAALYNGGRIISYTVIGGLAGALGSLVSVSTRFTGLVQLAAGIFMIAMGINMLGIFPALRRFIPRLPNIFARKIDKQKSGGKNPFFIGLLNGLMPCGPLQAMQIYALSTGNPVSGALSMFVFSIGTVPLIAGIGALSSFLSADGRSPAFARRVTQTGAVLVTVMGMTMLSYGLNLSGINLPGINLDFADKAFAARPAAASRIKDYPSGADPFVPVIENGVQLVNSTLNAGRYPPITVQQGIPVRWTIDAPAGSINGCNNSMIIREYGIEHRFKQGENIIEFTPAKKGKFTYSCWMGMIRGTITVVEEGYAGAEDTEAAPVPAGVAIPTENITLAKIAEDGSYQTINTKLHDDGIDSAIIVVQRSLPASWIINNDSADPGNSRLIFPAYYTQINITAGDNIIRLMPSDDFDFSTVDNVFYGYVKVVDDLNEVNIEAIKREAAEHETLIYPDSYFETAASGGCSCCSR
jgi:sulfite exporter TauE/SafE